MGNITVRMKVAIAGANYRAVSGQEILLDSAEAKRLIKAGFAEAVGKKPAARAETRTTKKASKKAAKKAAKK